MRPNINDTTRLADLKKILSEKNVSEFSISTIERAIKRGMVFKKPEDLALLNIPAIDISAISGVVDIGTTIVTLKNLKRVEYSFKPIPESNAGFFYGYQLIVTYTNKEEFQIEQSYPIEDSWTVIVDLDLNDILEKSKVTLEVKSAQGAFVSISIGAASSLPIQDRIEIQATALANASINVSVNAIDHIPNPLIKDSYQVKGKVISNLSEAKLDGYQVILYAATNLLEDSSPDFVPVAFARTETNGYFVTTYLSFTSPDDIDKVLFAKAVVTKNQLKNEQVINLLEKIEGAGELAIKKSQIPERLILVIEEGIVAKEGDCGCGCSELNFHEKKVVEEYSYYTVVRTTEPSIIADVLENEKEIDLDDIYGIRLSIPFSVFQKFHAIESKQIKSANFSINNISSLASDSGIPVVAFARAAGDTASIDTKASFNRGLLDKLLIEHKIKTVIKGNAKPVFKGRTHLNQLNQIDWDDEPTIYQAASIAHGHLLHFKQEWIPDGYSIGDLVYSLPLAPGQKKQIAVLDWERRESAANSQFLGYEETLNNSLVRDRDISEVVNATLTENIKGNSKASTGGIGFGLGSSVMGVIPGVGTFGSLLGISGGTSSSGSTASQSSNRESTANSLQSLTDRTLQAASVVRSQRSTVVQTVSQGERVQATAESVANYNHCHAITIQYFEVLRHFSVRNRLAGVQECLFVPLQMSPFDMEKCLRWRNTLERYLLKRSLRPAFDAITRIQNEKESSYENYYDSIGFPRKNYAEQNLNFYSGDLYMDFFFFNVKEDKINEEIITFFSLFGISLDAFRDKKITDEELANHVGPRAIEYLLDAFTVETDKGVDLALDLTLISTFRQNTTLRVSLKQSPTTPITVPRNQIDAINVKLDLTKLSVEEAKNLKQFQNKFMKIRVRSGNLFYRTDNIAGVLFNGRLDNDIFAEGDGVYVRTPLTSGELRNPRGEDVESANNLIHHLNENLEYYHKCLYFDMTPERRFMLLDGIIAPGKANGRSVASVVENRLIGIAGNSLIMPVAPGYQLDPTIDKQFDLFAQYYHDEQEPIRVSMPTKGIYAESVMGKCNSCEVKDETRFWRWEESPIPDSPNTQILPLDTSTRRTDPGNLQPKDFPAPIVNIQNAPAAPDPTGLQNLLQLIGKGDSFRDLTGLNQNQLNALATFQKTMDTAQAFGKEAAELAKAAATMKVVEEAKKSGTISNEQAQEHAGKVLEEVTKPKDAELNKVMQGIDAIDKFQKEGKIDDQTASSTKDGLIKNFLDSSSKKTSMTNDEIKGLADVAKSNGTDISVERADGEKVKIAPSIGGLKTLESTESQKTPNANVTVTTKIFRMIEDRTNKITNVIFEYEIQNNEIEPVNFSLVQKAMITLKREAETVLAAKGFSVILKPKEKVTTKFEYPLDPDNQTMASYEAPIYSRDYKGDPRAQILPATTLFQYPFPKGTAIRCDQSFDGLNSSIPESDRTHTGLEAFAVDFSMPIGTQVCAAREGIVVEVISNFADYSQDPYSPIESDKGRENKIKILHSDNTYSTYAHIKQNSSRVTVGRKVAIGDIICLSGHNGYSTGPHLHFEVSKSNDEGKFQTLEFSFNDGHGNPITPQVGTSYTRI